MAQKQLYYGDNVWVNAFGKEEHFAYVIGIRDGYYLLLVRMVEDGVYYDYTIARTEEEILRAL